MSIGQTLDSQIKDLIRTAAQKHQATQLNEAELIYKQILQTQSEDDSKLDSLKHLYPLILTDLGTVLQKQGKLEEAIDAYRRALSINPNLVEARHNLGKALNQQGKSAEAAQVCQPVLRLNSSDAQGYKTLGAVFKEQVKSAATIQAYQEPQKCTSSLAQTYCDLGRKLKAQGQLEEAAYAYQQALKLDPGLAKAHNNLGTIFKVQGKLEEAAHAYHQALKLDPELAAPYSNLGTISTAQRKLATAVQMYRQALKLNPNFAGTYYNLGNVLRAQGKLVEAGQAYQQALRLDPNFAEAEFSLCISQLPTVYSHFEEISASRARYQQHLNNLSQRYRTAAPAERVNAARAVGVSQPFYLAYQGENDRDLQRSYGELLCHLMTSCYPQWSRLISPRSLDPRKKIRVGFVSGHFHYHSVWKIPLRGWIENLDRSKFELFGYYTNAKCDAETSVAQQCFTKFVQGPFSTSRWGEIIQQERLHVLIFPEFGMEQMTLRLGCLRLAPVQVAFGGHPETSGLPTIDYHLSSALMEPENGQEHYTETLIRLPNLAVYYSPIEVQPTLLTKQDLGLRDTDILFWCCQSLYKYLPQHDDIFPRISQKIKNSRFVFIKHLGDNSEVVTKTFLKRLSYAFKSFDLDYKNHCVFLSRLDKSEFAGVTAIADIFLDTIEWSGNNTAMESAAFHVPMVTFPGSMMRGRHVMAILKRMGIDETIASSKDEYIEIAARLAKDRNYRQQVATKIAKNKHKLYNDLAPIKSLETFLSQVAKGHDFSSVS